MESQPKRLCLFCGEKIAINRGLCSTHHSRYYKEVREMSDEQKAVFDAALIARGLLLPLQKPGPKVDDNPYAVIAEELFAAESSSDYQEESPGPAEEESAENRPSQKKPKASPKGKKNP